MGQFQLFGGIGIARTFSGTVCFQQLSYTFFVGSFHSRVPEEFSMNHLLGKKNPSCGLLGGSRGLHFCEGESL